MKPSASAEDGIRNRRRSLQINKDFHSHRPVRVQDTTPSPINARTGIKSEWKGKKISGKKMETFPPIQRADENSPLFKRFAISPKRHRSTKNHLSAPNLFAHPTRIGPRRSLVAAFQRPPLARIRAHL
jgi:hypothetical protein